MTRLLGKLTVAIRLATTLGPLWLAGRAVHGLKKKAGWARFRLPACRWQDHPLDAALRAPELGAPAAYARYRRSGAPKFLFQPGDRAAGLAWFAAWDADGVGPIAAADAIACGEFRLFGLSPLPLGFPPAWNRNFQTGCDLPDQVHWSRIGDFSHGDIKTVWELSRFGFAFTLVRSYWRTGEEQYAERFWQLLEDWRLRNPPNQGPNWKCGQEVSLRVIAWCFALYGFLDAAATTPERLSALAEMVAVSGTRIEATLGYALSQKNNHGISEGAGLWTIGLLFPEFRLAERWRRLGQQVLESQSRELIYEDGSFSQHSVNYHRVMLHDLIWSVRLGAVNGVHLGAGLMDRLQRAGAWLHQLHDPSTGGTPHYGHDDGALVLPLSNCDQSDSRPVLQTIGYLTEGVRPFVAGPWDEDLFWLYGADALSASVRTPPVPELRLGPGGYSTLRASTGLAFVRCVERFRHRPGQADLLHVDLWWQGHNLALDPGTFSYNARGAWDNCFSRTRYHNTVEVDGVDQMDRAGRFLWLPWATGRVTRRAESPEGGLSYWEGEHHGYRRLPSAARHRRAIVRLGQEHWVVLDAIVGRGPIEARLHWLLADTDRDFQPLGQGAEVVLRTSAGAYRVLANRLDRGSVEPELVRARDGVPEGWRSPNYLTLAPALSLSLRSHGESLVRFCTIFGPAEFAAETGPEAVRVTWADQAAILTLGAGAVGPLATAVTLEGRSVESLNLIP